MDRQAGPREKDTDRIRESEGQGLAATEERHPTHASGRAVRWYVTALLGFPCLLIGGSLLWMSSAEYQRHSQYPSFVGIGYGSRMRGADCDVVVDGDSSALTGVVPKVIRERTGLTTCNIAEVAGVKMLNGFLELDDYLAHNKPPRYLVFEFVPENLTDPGRWREVASFEGWFYRLRFHRDRGLLGLMAHDPEGVMISAELGLRTGLQWLPQGALPPQLSEIRERNGGQLMEPGGTLTECRGPIAVRAPDRLWLQSLRQRYSRAETRVLIDVTPEPPCDPSLRFFQERTGPGVTDNSLQTLPLAEYTDTGRLHTNDVGAEHLSERIAEQITALNNGSNLGKER